jgi:hypothetical protein
MGSPSEEESESSGAGHVISQVPNTPEVDMGFEVDPGTFEEASQAGILETVVAALRDMAQAIDKENLAILGLHRDFGAVGGVMADDLHALDIPVQSLQTTVGTPRLIPNVVDGNVWEALAAVGSVASGSSGSAAAIDVQTRLGSLAAETRNWKQELTSVRADRGAHRQRRSIEAAGVPLGCFLELKTKRPGLPSGSVSSSVGNLYRGTESCQGQAAVGVNALRAMEGLKCGVTPGSWSHSTNDFQ